MSNGQKFLKDHPELAERESAILTKAHIHATPGGSIESGAIEPIVANFSDPAVVDQFRSVPAHVALGLAALRAADSALVGCAVIVDSEALRS